MVLKEGAVEVRERMWGIGGRLEIVGGLGENDNKGNGTSISHTLLILGASADYGECGLDI